MLAWHDRELGIIVPDCYTRHFCPKQVLRSGSWNRYEQAVLDSGDVRPTDSIAEFGGTASEALKTLLIS